MNEKNTMQLIIPSLSENESFARTVVGVFASKLNPTLNDIADIKTAVSEAVTNCIVHAYQGGIGEITIRCCLTGEEIIIEIADKGCGIQDVEKARQPFYSTAGDQDRSGMGFTVMETFMDKVDIRSVPEGGTTVVLTKRIRRD